MKVKQVAEELAEAAKKCKLADISEVIQWYVGVAGFDVTIGSERFVIRVQKAKKSCD